MTKHPKLIAYILIGVGLYFVLKQYNIPILSNFSTWPTLLIIVGIAFIVHSISSRDDPYLLSGIIILGIGIHFHGQQHYPSWIDHWAVYILIIGVALTIRYFISKKGLILGLLLIGLSIIFIFSISIPEPLQWIHTIAEQLESFWPFLLIVIGVYLLIRK